MGDMLAAGDAFIWVTSILAGAVLCFSAYRLLAARTLSEAKRSMLGDWYGYAHYHSQNVDRFYKENITIARNRIFPWRLQMTATSTHVAQDIVYRGELQCNGPFFFCTSHEPIYDDTVFEISHRIMDRENGETIVGICVGMTYDKPVHCATAYVWARQELDPKASRGRPADPEVERQRFHEIARAYFIVSQETYQLKMI